MSETPMKKQALLIGINEYQILPELKYARQDAEAVEQALKQNYCFSDDEVMLLTDAKPGLFKPSNRRIIEKHLEKLAEQDLDLFIFGFWGHGLFRNGQRYFCPLDAISEDIEELGLSFDSLQRLLSNVKAKNTCLILDCCQKVHDRGEEETLTADDQAVMENAARDIVFRRQETEPEFVSNVAILNSCKQGQAAYEWDSRKHGIFTAHLLDALNRRYDSVAQIVGYISKNVEKTAMELGKMQTPLCRLEGDIALPVDTRPKPMPPQPQQQSTSKSNGVKGNIAFLALVVLLGITTLYLLATGRGKSAPAPEDNVKPASPEDNDKPVSVNNDFPSPVNNDLPAPAYNEKPQQTQKQVGYEYQQNQTKVIPAGQQTFDQFNQLPDEGKEAGERAVVTFNGVEFAFRWCPAGTFTMGSPLGEFGRVDNETQHQVNLTKGFWMMETEVTQKQWKAVMENNPSYFKDDDLPVEKVSWDDCQDFCKKTGLSLPTEAQWEYACRAGTTGEYAGNLDEMAWYAFNSDEKSYPVGTTKPNAWGLYDMHGNVWEWCQDWYGDYPSESITDPIGQSSGSKRVVRGGGWIHDAQYCRSANRSFLLSISRDCDLGFRCVKCQ